MPILRDTFRMIRRARQRAAFVGSESYWEERYRRGGHAGAGSRDRLARFKADFLNAFVADHDIRSVIEFGCGDGQQLALARYPAYVGVDISHVALETCRAAIGDRPNHELMHLDAIGDTQQHDLSLSLDVIYHLVEDAVFERHLHQTFDASGRYAIIFSSDWEGPWPDPHVRHRNFTNWVASHRPDFRLIAVEPNPYPYLREQPDTTSFADFHIFQRQSGFLTVEEASAI